MQILYKDDFACKEIWEWLATNRIMLNGIKREDITQEMINEVTNIVVEVRRKYGIRNKKIF